MMLLGASFYSIRKRNKAHYERKKEQNVEEARKLFYGKLVIVAIPTMLYQKIVVERLVCLFMPFQLVQ